MADYCRLCAELKECSEIVASIDDIEQSVEEKLRTCCQWTTENTEYCLPNGVCSSCSDKLDKCWLFAQGVQLAQQRLIEIFGKWVIRNIIISYGKWNLNNSIFFAMRNQNRKLKLSHSFRRSFQRFTMHRSTLVICQLQLHLKSRVSALKQPNSSATFAINRKWNSAWYEWK